MNEINKTECKSSDSDIIAEYADKAMVTRMTDLVGVFPVQSRMKHLHKKLLTQSLELEVKNFCKSGTYQVTSIKEALILAQCFLTIERQRGNDIITEFRLIEYSIHYSVDTKETWTEIREWKDKNNKTFSELLVNVELDYNFK